MHKFKIAKEKYIYDENDKLVKIETYRNSMLPSSKLMSTTLQYDENGKLKGMKIINNNTKIFDIQYHDNGNIKSIKHYTDCIDINDCVYSEYDDNNILLKRQVSNMDSIVEYLTINGEKILHINDTMCVNGETYNKLDSENRKITIYESIDNLKNDKKTQSYEYNDYGISYLKECYHNDGSLDCVYNPVKHYRADGKIDFIDVWCEINTKK